MLDVILKNDNVVVGDNDKQKDNKVIFKSDDKFRGGDNIDRNGMIVPTMIPITKAAILTIPTIVTTTRTPPTITITIKTTSI